MSETTENTETAAPQPNYLLSVFFASFAS